MHFIIISVQSSLFAFEFTSSTVKQQLFTASQIALHIESALKILCFKSKKDQRNKSKNVFSVIQSIKFSQFFYLLLSSNCKSNRISYCMRNRLFNNTMLNMSNRKSYCRQTLERKSFNYFYIFIIFSINILFVMSTYYLLCMSCML